MIRITLFAATLLAACLPAAAEPDNHRMIDPDRLEWAPVASLPAGAEVALIEGNLGEPGPFTFRLRLPAGYRIPPHWHPVTERVTVLQGTFTMALGERFETGSGMALTPGGMMLMQPQTRHFAWTGDEPVILQLHGTGPWAIHYVDPADDPRQR